jgi:2-methylcitrate dehydratase PrpD
MLLGAALSVGESTGVTGKELLKAYVLAIEVMCKLAANSPNVQDRGFHSTPVWGSLGAAVACASLLKLDAAHLKAALGIAASAAGGIHRQQGSMVKPFHAGNAARNGAEAAFLARSGFTADNAILEAPRGFCDTFFGPATCNFDKMIENIGQPFFLESPGLGLKWHPCSAPQFLAADAALHLKHEHAIRYENVARVEVRVPPLRYQRHYAVEVKTGLRGKFAINYVVAMCILDGKLELATFTDQKVNQPNVQEALGKVEVVCDEGIPEPGPYCPITVELKDGVRHSFTARIAKGDPRNPMTETEVIEKFRSNAKRIISDEQAEKVTFLVQNLEAVDNLRELVGLLVPG